MRRSNDRLNLSRPLLRRQQARRTPPPLPLLAAAAALLLVVVAAVALMPRDERDAAAGQPAQSQQPTTPEAADDGNDAEAESIGDAPSSTPREHWKKGEMPYLYQIDPQWSATEYSGGRLAEQGCGPTALSMVYIHLTGNTDLDPAQMAAFSTENGYATDGNGSSWTLMTEGAAKLGLTGAVLPPVPDTLRASLEAGHPLICVMAPGTFTEVGHYIVVERMGAGGKAVVHDSNSVGRSMRTWDLDLICSEASNVWSFSLA